MSEIEKLHNAWLQADRDWTRALWAAYPKRWVSDVRSEEIGQGEPGTPLRAAYTGMVYARDAFLTAGGWPLFHRLKKED